MSTVLNPKGTFSLLIARLYFDEDADARLAAALR